jgi:hypothetical protein
MPCRPIAALLSATLLILPVVFLVPVYASENVDAASSGGLEWQTAYAVGKFSFAKPPKPDQIFKIQYRVVNGTVENFYAQSWTSADVSTVNGGVMEIKYPRN